MVRPKKRRLSDAYIFEGFVPNSGCVRGIFGRPKARVLPLKRRSKKLSAALAALYITVGMIVKRNGFETCHVAIPMCTWKWKFAGYFAGNAAR